MLPLTQSVPQSKEKRRLRARYSAEIFPLYCQIENGKDAYVLPEQLQKASRGARRKWEVAGRICSLEQSGGGIVKRADVFGKHFNPGKEKGDVADPTAFYEFLRECRAFDVRRPSSYSDCFHTIFKAPRVPRTYNSIFEPYRCGAWEEAKLVGVFKGRWNKYDLNSAYLWASTQGLPVVESMETTTQILDNRHGMYLVELEQVHEGLPYPLNDSIYVNISHEEMALYQPAIKRVIRGVTWTDYEQADVVEMTIKKFSFWKECAKTFWGRWLSTIPITCTTESKSWRLPNPVLNLMWSHLLISRVKMRVWECSKGAAHIFVDSVITRDVLPTGLSAGDWRLDDVYPLGIKIRRAGFYGSAVKENWDKTCGERQLSA